MPMTSFVEQGREYMPLSRKVWRHRLQKGDPVRIVRNGRPSRTIYPFHEHLKPSDQRVWWKPHHLRHLRWATVINTRGDEMLVSLNQLVPPE